MFTSFSFDNFRSETLSLDERGFYPGVDGMVLPVASVIINLMSGIEW
jgi:hypothetical protein